MYNSIFYACVDLLEWIAEKVGMTYEEINVWFFCVIWPIISFGLVIIIIWQNKVIRKLQKSPTYGS